MSYRYLPVFLLTKCAVNCYETSLFRTYVNNDRNYKYEGNLQHRNV
jgi:hypothetical protein